MHREVVKVLTLVALLCVTHLGMAQLSAAERHAAALKKQVDKCAVGAPITLIHLDGAKTFGVLVSDDAAGVVILETGRQAEVTVPFGQLSKIKSGPKAMNSLGSGHFYTNPGFIVLVGIVIGGFFLAAYATRT